MCYPLESASNTLLLYIVFLYCVCFSHYCTIILADFRKCLFPTLFNHRLPFVKTFCFKTWDLQQNISDKPHLFPVTDSPL